MIVVAKSQFRGDVSDTRKANHFNMEFLPRLTHGLRSSLSSSQTQFQRVPNHRLRDGIRLGRELIADGRPDKIAAVRVEPFLDEEVDTAEVHIAKIDRDFSDLPAFSRSAVTFDMAISIQLDGIWMVSSWFQGLSGRLVRQLRVHVHRAKRTDLGRIGMRQLGAEQDDLRGVVHPDQQDHDRGRRAVGGFKSLRADVPADGELADVEQAAPLRTAPGRTSPHAISVSGNHLNSMANSAVRIASDAAKLMASPTARDNVPAQDDNAARIVLSTRETASRKPRPRIPANDTR